MYMRYAGDLYSDHKNAEAVTQIYITVIGTFGYVPASV